MNDAVEERLRRAALERLVQQDRAERGAIDPAVASRVDAELDDPVTRPSRDRPCRSRG